MAVKVKTKHGLIDVANGVIATVVGSTVTASYGVAGMASKSTIRGRVNEILDHTNYKRDVVVKSVDSRITVDVYIIIGYGLKVSKVSRNVQDNAGYNLEQQLSIQTKSVNVTAQDVKVLDE